MDIQHKRWNEYYYTHIASQKDNWLHYYKPIISLHSDPCILDLGCGNGSNLGFLCSMSKSVYGIDFSEEAIEQVKRNYSVDAILGDISNPLPYKDNMFDFIISDLSLHYFSEEQTFGIIEELCRVLKQKGIILARLNSIIDKKHGAQQGNEIEHYYYENNGIKKRFFDNDMIRYFFEKQFDILDISEKTSGKYLEEKYLWEIVLKRKV